MEFEFEYISKYKEITRLAAEELKAVVNDKLLPLDERWELFKKYGKGLASEVRWIQRPDAFTEKFGDTISEMYLDGEFVSRHETVHWIDWVEWIKDDMEYEPDRIYKVRFPNPDFKFDQRDPDIPYDQQAYIYREEKMTEEDIDAFREEILSDFKWSFVFDW